MEDSKEKIRQMVAYMLDCERTTDEETINSYTDTIMLGANEYAEAKFNNVDLADVRLSLPDADSKFLSVKDVIKLCERLQFHNRPHDRADEDYYAVYVSLLKENLIDMVK